MPRLESSSSEPHFLDPQIQAIKSASSPEEREIALERYVRTYICETRLGSLRDHRIQLLAQLGNTQQISAVVDKIFSKKTFWQNDKESLTHYVMPHEFIVKQASIIGVTRPGPARDALIDKCLEEKGFTLAELNIASGRRFCKVTFQTEEGVTDPFYIDLNKLKFENSSFYNQIDQHIRDGNLSAIPLSKMAVDGLSLAIAMEEDFFFKEKYSEEKLSYLEEALRLAGYDQGIPRFKELVARISNRERVPSS